MLLVILIALAALVLIGAGVVLARRGGAVRERPQVQGEPPAPPAREIPTPTVEELEELLQVEAPPEVEAPPVVEPEVLEPEVVEPEVIEKPRLRDRLGRTASAFTGAFGRMRGRKVDDETWDELEEALLLADVGMTTTSTLMDAVRTRAKEQSVTEPDDVIALMRDEVSTLLESGSTDRSLHATPGEANVWMFVGVNGVGKTTTIGKLASQRVADGEKVVLAAADTFRAAAADQLEMWAQRTGGEIVRSNQDGADPGSIVFDAMAAASSRSADLVLVDTAGRLHTKSNLMEELKKLRRIVDRTPGACKEVLLVIDASTGQNGLVQAKQFADAVDVTGIVLTKLDGTAKGGIVLAIQSELGIPVKVVGVGEGIGDLIEFDPEEFAAALFGTDS
jgi:fused signal recognition particle receptor